MEKILTIAVPSYNADWCLAKCLDSFIDPHTLDQLDVIVVNDGSTDGTLRLAESYAQKYPDTFRVLDKPNGGHGSGINAAIPLASGRYFKVIDADDWVITENLAQLLLLLAQADADVVLTNFHTVDMNTGRRQAFRTQGVSLGREYALDDYMQINRDALQCATFHGIIYRTGFYRNSGVRLTEKIFYEDQEYATLPFRQAKTILPLDLFVYEYLIGNTNQSVSDLNQVKRIGQIETVIWSIAGCYLAHPEMSPGARNYFLRKLSDLLLSYYVVALVKNTDRTSGRQDVRRLRGALTTKLDELVRSTDKKYRIALAMNYLHISNRTLELLKRSIFYKTLYKAIRNK